MKKPDFPDLFPDNIACWGQGNHVLAANLIASIPTFTLYEKGDPERDRLEELYWKEKQSQYNDQKKIYDENIFVGTTFCGTTDVSMRITKIHIDIEKAYICSKISHEFQKVLDERNLNRPQYMVDKGTKYPVKPMRFSLVAFISMIKSKQITIINTNRPI